MRKNITERERLMREKLMHKLRNYYGKPYAIMAKEIRKLNPGCKVNRSTVMMWEKGEVYGDEHWYQAANNLLDRIVKQKKKLWDRLGMNDMTINI